MESQGDGSQPVTMMLHGNGPGGHRCDAVPSATGPESSSSGSAGTRPRVCAWRRAHERDYVSAVLEFYVWLPGTAAVTSRHDRRCARMLFARGVPVELAKSAMVVAIARRTFRTGQPLPRVRALHFFVPVIEELAESPCEPGYVEYLELRLRPLAAEKAAGSASAVRLVSTEQ